jgi:hypothetical protein
MGVLLSSSKAAHMFPFRFQMHDTQHGRFVYHSESIFFGSCVFSLCLSSRHRLNPHVKRLAMYDEQTPEDHFYTANQSDSRGQILA